MNIKKQLASLGAPERARSRVASVWASLAVLAMIAPVALGQAEQQDSGPLDNTWDYLVELFRMVLGL